MEIILASQSPRRRELMELIGMPFTVRVADVDETLEACPPEEAVALLSRKKAEAARETLDEVVIGADTVVVLDGKILGKPTDAIDTIKAAPCAGMIPYVPLMGDAADPYQCARISIWFDNAKKRNEFDADGCLSFVCLDQSAVKRFKLPTE